MYFFALRVLLKPRDPDLFQHSGEERCIEHFEQAIVHASKNIKRVSQTPSVHKNWQYRLKLSVAPTDGVMAGLISKQKKLHGYNEDFQEYNVPSFPPVVWLWDRQEQVILIERKTTVFKSAHNAAIMFEELSNNDYLVEKGLRIFIEPCLEKDNFWVEYDKLRHIEQVTFALVMPNIFGDSKKALTDALNTIEDDTNTTALTTTFENKDGNLNLRDSTWANVLVDWTNDGGGSWQIKGKKSPTAKSITLNSEPTAKLIFVDGSLSECTLSGYSANDVKDIISLVRKDYRFEKCKN